ncbi:hypothetical protein LTR27_004053 [Elasticomyces elasticus]|nr:hypothetical protein LTR27_004053 [Elasticomyces elasticus]
MTTSMNAARSIGGVSVGPVGYGLMGLTMPWAPVEYPVAAALLKAALEQGANFWNGGIHYGTPDANSLHLLKYYFEKYPEDAVKVVLSIKGAFSAAGPVGSPEALRASVEEAVKVLGDSKTIDVFEMARVDPNVPIEASVQALGDLVKEGKIVGIGLSETGAKTIRRAHAIHPIAAVEVELSLFTPDPLKNGIALACQELNIPLVAYSPLGRGQLTSDIRKLDDLPADDFRRTKPRFAPEAFDQNVKLMEAVHHLAERRGFTSAQVAIAWVVHQGAIPIPGSTKMERLVLNSRAVSLTQEDLSELQSIIDRFPVAGERYGGAHEALLNM